MTNLGICVMKICVNLSDFREFVWGEFEWICDIDFLRICVTRISCDENLWWICGMDLINLWHWKNLWRIWVKICDKSYIILCNFEFLIWKYMANVWEFVYWRSLWYENLCDDNLRWIYDMKLWWNCEIEFVMLLCDFENVMKMWCNLGNWFDDYLGDGY